MIAMRPVLNEATLGTVPACPSLNWPDSPGTMMRYGGPLTVVRYDSPATVGEGPLPRPATGRIAIFSDANLPCIFRTSAGPSSEPVSLSDPLWRGVDSVLTQLRQMLAEWWRAWPHDEGGVWQDPPRILSNAEASFVDIALSMYAVEVPASVRAFLVAHPNLAEVLVDARGVIARGFESVVPHLRVRSFPEENTETELQVRIPTSLSVPEALARLERLQDEWWLERMPATRGCMTIDVEFR